LRRSPRVLVTGTVTGMLALGLVGAPAQGYSRAEKRAEKRQNSAIKKTRSSLSKTNKSVLDLRSSTKATTDAIARVASAAGAESKKNSATIAAVVPAVTTALTQLRDGLSAAGTGLGQLRDGMTQLRTGLETVGANLTRLGDAYQSVEYGAVRLYAGSATSTGNEGLQAVPGVSANSDDIPDDANGTLVTANVPVPTDDPLRVTLRSAIRSNEVDGNPTGDPAGQAAGILYAKCIEADGCDAGANEDFIPAGAAACTPAGPPPHTSFPAPVGPQPVVNVQQRAPRTGFVNPTPNDTNPTGGDCVLPGAGVYEVTFNVQFFDFPTSATPGPRD